MKKLKGNREDPNKTIPLLFVLFIAIVLKEAIRGTLSVTGLMLMGGIIISLSLSAILFSGRRRGDILKDR